MGLLDRIVGAGVGQMAEGIAGAIDRFVETEEERKAADLLLLKAQQEPDKWQAEINKIEASHRSLFVSGWRPAIGWICALSLAWGWIARPIVDVAFAAFQIDIDIPTIMTGEAISLVMAMLGMGALRTYEKKQGLTG